MAHPQKDTKWSTEAELAGMNNVPSPAVCTRVYFPTGDMVTDLFTEPLQEAFDSIGEHAFHSDRK